MTLIRKGFEVTPKLRRKIIALAKKVGCPLNWKRSCGIQWNGKDTACKGEDASNIIHDIAHFAIASKKERKHFDFGLGKSPSTQQLVYDNSKLEPLYDLKICSDKEQKASALGIYWEKKIGLPWRDTAAFHSWNDTDLLKTSWKVDLSRLIRKINKQ
jgi:hypothetical protein